MPNLKQLKKLKEIYGDNSASNLKKSDIDILLEAFDPNKIGKTSTNLKNKSFSFSEPKATGYVEYFIERKKVDVVILFIDITSFSTKFINKSTNSLVKYLDRYYKHTIPIINQHGGEIEKIMGDGIICVFGEPFLNESLDELHDIADKCSREIVSTLIDTDYEVKIALHSGEIMYYQNPCDEYYEYTMVGSALTELFRLESVAHGNCINYFNNTFYADMLENKIDTFEDFFARHAGLQRPDWNIKNVFSVNLPGIGFSQIKRIEYTGMRKLKIS